MSKGKIFEYTSTKMSKGKIFENLVCFHYKNGKREDL